MLDLNEIKELVEALHEAEEEVSQAIDEAAQAWAEVKRLRAEIEQLQAFVPSPELMQRLATLDEGYAKCVDEAYQTYEAQAQRIEEETDAQPE